jgi:hypothetical protein
MSDELSTRDRVRALVREVLNNALPEDEAQPAGREQPPTQPSARMITTAPVAPEPTEAPVTRDESSKPVITEDDVRGLEPGARLRIAEGARLTPLAADIVRERRIELVRRTSRRGAQQPKLVAVGADHGGYPMKEE